MFCQTQPHHGSSFQPFPALRSRSGAHRSHPTCIVRSTHVHCTRILPDKAWPPKCPSRGSAPSPSHHSSASLYSVSGFPSLFFNSFLGRFLTDKMQLPGLASPVPPPPPPVEKSSITSILSRQTTVTMNRSKTWSSLLLSVAKAQVKIWFSCSVCEPATCPCSGRQAASKATNTGRAQAGDSRGHHLGKDGAEPSWGGRAART